MLTIQGTLGTVKAASPVSLAGTFVGAGAGATLTSAVNIALVVDGYPAVVGDRVLLLAQATPTQNGIYDVTASGSGVLPWVLTRSADLDGHVVGQVKAGLFVFVENGNINGASTLIQTGTGTGPAASIIVDTDAMVFTAASLVVYAFKPGAAVFVVNEVTYGIAKAHITSVSMSHVAPDPAAKVSYLVAFDTVSRGSATVDASTVFADVNSAWVYYQPRII